jgi:hypothetical protein
LRRFALNGIFARLAGLGDVTQQLILKRAPIGEWTTHDYDVLTDGRRG